MIIWPQWVSRRGTLDWIARSMLDHTVRSLESRRFFQLLTPRERMLEITMVMVSRALISGFLAGFLLGIVLC